MKRKPQTQTLINNALIASIGIIILLAITQFMCKSSSEFCSYGYKVFAVIIVIVLLAIRHFLRRK